MVVKVPVAVCIYLMNQVYFLSAEVELLGKTLELKSQTEAVNQSLKTEPWMLHWIFSSSFLSVCPPCLPPTKDLPAFHPSKAVPGIEC